MYRIILIATLACFTTFGYGQKRVTLSGFVKDAFSGEDLIYANVFNKENTLDGVATNIYGFYSLSLFPGTYTITCSYIGYEDKEFVLDLQSDTTINITMSVGTVFDSVVVVTDERGNETVAKDCHQTCLRSQHCRDSDQMQLRHHP